MKQASLSDSNGRLGSACIGIARLRWLLCLAACAAFGWAAYLHATLPWLGILQALLTLGGVNLALILARKRGLAPMHELRIGLGVDMLCLTELLAFSGGPANPLASLYLPPLMLAALFAPGRFTWALAIFAITAYAALFKWHWPWPEEMLDPAYAFTLHMGGMWLTLALSVLLIAGFVASLARRLSAQEAALVEAREIQLRDEQLVALGVQAAGAAHALSTPLNTLTLLVDELAYLTSDRPELGQDWMLARQSLASCQHALTALKSRGESDPLPEPLFAALAARLDDWSSLKPASRLSLEQPDGEGPRVRISPLFWPALYNLLNNAAEAGTGHVEVKSWLTGGLWHIEIVNPSGALSNEQLSRAGLAEQDSSKPVGLGLGMLLSHATLSRLGGSVNLANRAAGGVCAQLILPIILEADSQ